MAFPSKRGQRDEARRERQTQRKLFSTIYKQWQQCALNSKEVFTIKAGGKTQASLSPPLVFAALWKKDIPDGGNGWKKSYKLLNVRLTKPPNKIKGPPPSAPQNAVSRHNIVLLTLDLSMHQHSRICIFVQLHELCDQSGGRACSVCLSEHFGHVSITVSQNGLGAFLFRL